MNNEDSLCNRVRRFINSLTNNNSVTPTINHNTLSFNELVLENYLANQRMATQNLLNPETHDKAIDDLHELKHNRPNWLTTFGK